VTHEDRHRGRHPGDDRLFGPDEQPALRTAVAELSWLLTRGYADASALKLVGDRHNLSSRQRQAVGRCACSDPARDVRIAHRRTRDDLAGQRLAVDGFNALIIVESALSHGLVLRGRDGALRDMASVHGSYRQVAETSFALGMLGRHLHGPPGAAPHGPIAVDWYLDRPVANSGRLRAILQEMAELRGWPWTVELVQNPDAVLVDRHRADIVATSDAWILDHCERWFDLPASLLTTPAPPPLASDPGPILGARPDLWLLDLGSQGPPNSGIGGS
jgi:hypothetical protein